MTNHVGRSAFGFTLFESEPGVDLEGLAVHGNASSHGTEGSGLFCGTAGELSGPLRKELWVGGECWNA